MYALLNPIIGSPQIQNLGLVADASPLMPEGTLVTAQDPFWGTGEFVYARANGSIRQYGLTRLQPALSGGKYLANMTETPNTANLGQSIFVALNALSSGQWGWFATSGMVPINSTASVAALAAIGIAAAGQAGANSAGKQILGATVAAPATTTSAKTGCIGRPGQFTILVPNADGWFPGLILTGTGVGALSKVVSIAPDNRTVTVSVANAAAIAGTVTATYNDGTIYFNLVHLNRPFGQGAIT